MDPDESVQLLKSNICSNHASSRMKPLITRTLNLQTEKRKDLKQMRKKGCPKALKRLCLFNENTLLQMLRNSDLVRDSLHTLKRKYKIARLKSLKQLDVNLSWLIYTSKSNIAGFSELLKRVQDLSVLNFKISFGLSVLNEDKRRAFCKSIRQIHPSSHLKMKLSLDFLSSNTSDKQNKKLLESFCTHGCLTWACIAFNNIEFSEIQEVMALFKESKSLKRLDLSILRKEYNVPGQVTFQDILLGFMNIKPLKDLRITVHKLSLFTHSELNGMLPALKKLKQAMNLEIVFYAYEIIVTIPISSIFGSGWKQFVKSIKSEPSPYQVDMKYTVERGRDAYIIRFNCILSIFLLLWYVFTLLQGLFNIIRE